MRTYAGVRCDVCGMLEDKLSLTPDRRPPVGSRDRFFQFVVPPAEVTKLGTPVKGKFRGIASQSDPKKLAQLHACPPCAPKLQKAFKKQDPMILPPGPMRSLMLQVKQKYGARALRLH